ncbi:MAG: transmembrane Fragile-X-F protein [Candidatus Nitrosocosmicus sp.]
MDNSSSGVSFLSLLGLLFIALKIMKFIDWSWWLVLLPLYGGLLVFLLILVIVSVIAFIKG